MHASDILPATHRDSEACQETELTKGHVDNCRRCRQKPSKATDSTCSGVKSRSTKNVDAAMLLNKSNWKHILAQTLAWSGHVVSDLPQEA